MARTRKSVLLALGLLAGIMAFVLAGRRPAAAHLIGPLRLGRRRLGPVTRSPADDGDAG